MEKLDFDALSEQEEEGDDAFFSLDPEDARTKPGGEDQFIQQLLKMHAKEARAPIAPPDAGTFYQRRFRRQNREKAKKPKEYRPLHPHVWEKWRGMKESEALKQGAQKLSQMGHEDQREAAMKERLANKKPTAAAKQEKPPSASSRLTERNDFVEIGRKIAEKLRERALAEEGEGGGGTHLDMIHYLKMMERIWIKVSERGDGLTETEFVDFLSSMLGEDPDKLSILFQKMDANSDGTLTWDEYLSYLLREITHNWRFRVGKGTWHLQETDALPPDTGNVVTQVVILPGDPHMQIPGRYLFSCRDHTIQVWNSTTMQYNGLVPLDPVAQREKARYYGTKLKQRPVLSRTPKASFEEPPEEVHVPAVRISIEDTDEAQRQDNGSTKPFNPSLLPKLSLDTMSGGRRVSESKAKTARQPPSRTPQSSAQSRPSSARPGRKVTKLEAALSLLPSHMLAKLNTNNISTLPPVLAPTQKPLPYSDYRKKYAMPHTCLSAYLSKRQLVVASTQRIISFYAFQGKHFHLTNPNCRDDVLILGDTKGCVHVYDISSKTRLGGFEVHGTDIVRKVEYIPGVGLVSCGMDCTIAISDIDCQPRKWSVVRRLQGHTRGVHSFCYSQRYKCLVSAAYDRQVLVWDRFQNSPTEKLRVRHNGIVAVIMNDNLNQVFTVCSDKKIKVFDIRTFTNIQSLVDTTHHNPHDEITAAAFDPATERLVTVGSHFRLWPVQIAPGNTARKGGPNQLVVAVCYTPVFKQIITVTVDESVQLWDVFTGKNTFGFSTTHEYALSSACLDHRGKRLFTASHNGTVKMWNFNNGACMMEFEPIKQEVLSVAYIPKSMQAVLCIGSNREVIRWPDPANTKSTELMYLKDSEEMTCVAFNSDYIVTGCSTGQILVWFIESGKWSKRFTVPANPTDSQPDAMDEFVTVTPTHSRRQSNITVTDERGRQRPHHRHSNTIASTLPLSRIRTTPTQPRSQSRTPEKGRAHLRRRLQDHRRSIQAERAPAGLSQLYMLPLGPKNDMLIAGTDDGSLHFFNAKGWECVNSLFNVLQEPIVGIIASDDRTRLLVTDSRTAKVWDISQLSLEQPQHLLFINSWVPHPGMSITDVTCVGEVQVFVTSSDTGQVCLWTLSGQPVAELGQVSAWAIKDPGAEKPKERVGSAGVSSFAFGYDSENDEQDPAGRDAAPPDTPKPPAKIAYHESNPMFHPKTVRKGGMRMEQCTLRFVQDPSIQSRRRKLARLPGQHTTLHAKLQALEEDIRARQAAAKLRRKSNRFGLRVAASPTHRADARTRSNVHISAESMQEYLNALYPHSPRAQSPRPPASPRSRLSFNLERAQVSHY